MTQAGQPHDPDRTLQELYDEFCEAWLEGESPDKESHCRKYPAFADALRSRIDKFIATYQTFEESRSGSSCPMFEASEVVKNFEGEVLGDFELIREIGRGGMGVVYEARQTSLDRTVALKVLPAHVTLRKDAVLRFRREASTASKLKHTGIVEIYSIGEVEGHHFFAMELIEGAPLDKVIERIDLQAAFPLKGHHFYDAIRHTMHTREDQDEAGEDDSAIQDFWNKTYIEIVCRIVAQVADALDHAHLAGVIHRDVKPSNILIRPDGGVVLTDFGLARKEGVPSLSVTGELVGTPHYLAPEQASRKRKSLDHRVDLYSLGVTLYEMLTLTRPYSGKTSHEVMSKIVSKEPPMPRSRNVLIPKDLETICLMAVEKDPSLRYQSGRDFKGDLLNFLDFGPIQARPRGLATRAFRTIRRYPAYSAMAGMLILILIIGPLLFGVQQKVANLRIREALDNAEREKNAARQVSDFLSNIFRGSNPFLSLGKPMTAYDLLQRGSASIGTELEHQWEVQARLLNIIADSYRSIGHYDEAETHFIQSLDIYRSELGEAHESTVKAYYELARLYLLQKRLSEAGQYLEMALVNVNSIPDENDTLEKQSLVRKIRQTIGHLYLRKAQYTQAEEVLCRIIDEAQNDPREDFHLCHIREALFLLGEVYLRQRRFDEAEVNFLKCLEPCSATNNCRGHPSLHVNVVAGLSSIHRSRGDLNEADHYLREVYQWCLDALGKNHPLTYRQCRSLSILYLEMDRLEEAETFGSNALEGFSNALDQDHFEIIEILTILSDIYTRQGRLQEAESLLMDGLERSRTASNQKRNESIEFYDDFNRLPDIDVPLQKISGDFNYPKAYIGNADGVSNTLFSEIISRLANLYAMQGKYEKFIALYEEAIEKDPFLTSVFCVLLHSNKNQNGCELLRHNQAEATPSDWARPLALTSPQRRISLITVLDKESAHLLLHECEIAYDQILQLIQAETDQPIQPVTVYLTSNLDEYNRLGNQYGDARSSSYAAFFVNESDKLNPFSVTYRTGTDDSQLLYTKGLVRHAVVEQVMNGIDKNAGIPAWFRKGQAAKFERYFHPEYVKWSVQSALRPLGGLIPLDQLFGRFTFTEHDIHMAGLLCAYLDSNDASEAVKAAYDHSLTAIRTEENISEAFQALERTLIEGEENLRVFMDKYN